MTIGNKIASGFGFTLAIILAIGALSFWSTLQYLETSAAVTHTHEVLEDLEALISLLKDVETAQRGYLLTGKSDSLRPYREAIPLIKIKRDDLRARITDERQVERLEKTLDPLIRRRLEDTKELVGNEVDSAHPAVDFAKAIKEVREFRDKLVMDQIRDVIDEMEKVERRLLKNREADARVSAWITMITTGVGALAAIVLVSVGGYFLVRSITRPVRTAVDQLGSTSAEILASTTQQASGAQEQAAAVTQTMATVNEVTQTSDQAAQRAKSVGEAVQRTLDAGKTGRKVVEDSLVAMEAVKEKVETTAENILTLAEQAQAIGDIIATVNDIAEQTNLLALNAAIEASRAGEHGKGFSVVAGEVKALADQSKKATAQVRQILGEIQKATNTAVLSTEEVTKGVSSAIKVGGQAGETIKTLTDTLAEVSRATTQIVASVSQQATGMAQIHQAMKNIDTVAKQNSVATRQAAQAAENLNHLGVQLTNLIGK
jgi:methyl-accepting chemotaxis protein